MAVSDVVYSAATRLRERRRAWVRQAGRDGEGADLDGASVFRCERLLALGPLCGEQFWIAAASAASPSSGRITRVLFV